MEHSVSKKAARQVSAWAGGSTEELYIWPPDAGYAARDFAFRVSTATVDLPQSDFTPLPGYTRWIMPLTGAMALEHEGHGSAALGPLEAHRFEGGWITRSRGTCTDFNLMLGQGWEGSITAQTGELSCAPNGFAGVYAWGGPVRVLLPEGELLLEQGDLLALRGPGALTLPPGQSGAVCFTACPR